MTERKKLADISWTGPERAAPDAVTGDKALRYDGWLNGELVAAIESTGYSGRRFWALYLQSGVAGKAFAHSADLTTLKERAAEELGHE